MDVKILMEVSRRVRTQIYKEAVQLHDSLYKLKHLGNMAGGKERVQGEKHNACVSRSSSGT
jgi:hypothetical protein